VTILYYIDLCAQTVKMSAPFDACSLCGRDIPVVISKLVCCGRTCCLTCARDMFSLSGPSSETFAGQRKCRLCGTEISGARRDAHLFYKVQAELFGAVDAVCGELLECPRGCNFTGKSEDVWGHLRTGCDFATTKCSDCGATKIRGNLATHRATTCRRRRVCFCEREAVCTLPRYKLHIDEHCQSPRYTQLCDLSAEPGSRHMIRCGSVYFVGDGFVSASIGCACGGLFTLAGFVEHVKSL
jgi:hypothetical protein